MTARTLLGHKPNQRREHHPGQPMPPASPCRRWRDYLTGPSWSSRDWLPSGYYLSLFAPRRISRCRRCVGPAAAKLPGTAILVGGSREMLTADTRSDPEPIMLINISARAGRTRYRKPTMSPNHRSGRGRHVQVHRVSRSRSPFRESSAPRVCASWPPGHAANATLRPRMRSQPVGSRRSSCQVNTVTLSVAG